MKLKKIVAAIAAAAVAVSAMAVNTFAITDYPNGYTLDLVAEGYSVTEVYGFTFNISGDIDSGVGGGVKAQTVVGAADVIVDGGRDADNIDAIFAQRLGTPEGAVAADGDDAVQTKELAGGSRLALAFRSHEFFAAGSIKHGTAAVDDSGNTLFIQLDHVAADQAVPAPANAITLNAVMQCGTNNCTDAGVHAGCVAAAGKDTDSTDSHKDSSIFLVVQGIRSSLPITIVVVLAKFVNLCLALCEKRIIILVQPNHRGACIDRPRGRNHLRPFT